MKRQGFILLESVISVFVLLLIIYILTLALDSNFKLLNKNEEYTSMLNIAQNKINEAKCKVKYDENLDEEVVNIAVGEYTVKTIIAKNKNYYNCYKIDVNVKSKNRSIDLETYATKTGRVDFNI